jgi:hypothetical protein
MAETKLIDTLSADNGMWYTAILQSDSTFHSQGINSKSDLIEKMKIAQPDYALDENKLLLLFAQYHCINRLAYVNDLCITEATLAYNQIITCKSTNDSVILNEFKTLNSFEKGITINKQSQWTDKGCVNGVLIDVKSYLQPVKRNAFAVNWEFTEQPEIKRLKEYRKPGSLVTFKPGELSELNFGGKNNPLITYVALTTWDPKAQYVHGDYFDIPIRPVVLQWMEMKTPVLAEGTYNIWIAFRRSSTSGNTFKTTFIQDGKDNQVLPYTIDMSLYFNTSATPEANLAEGAKRYMAKQSNSVMGAKLLGSVKVEKAGRHSLRFESLTGGSGTTWWDLIQFIPVNENQLWPRFDSAGQSIFPGTYCNLIAPFEQICSGDLNN